MKIAISDLDDFVDFVDGECKGNLRDPRVTSKYLPFELIVNTTAATHDDPFEERYFQSQLALYREIAGRELDQWSGELHPVDVDSLIDTPNPQNIIDVGHVAENVRAVTSMLSLACLSGAARILDMGAGHGMSSEIYGFCAAQVHAVDIDPQLSELALLRASRRALNLRRSVLNFDTLSDLENEAYDAAFFFQSLHHALRPWSLIAELKRKLGPNGVIGFTGEPIQSDVWPHWGLRLDIESVYVAHKYGWFESGWSRTFIEECFRRAGMNLILLKGGHQGGLIGLASSDPAKLAAISSKAALLGYYVATNESTDQAQSFFSQIGAVFPQNSLGRSIRAHHGHAGGFLCFGPYIALDAGGYEVTFLLSLSESSNANPRPPAPIVFDIVSENGINVHCKERIAFGANETRRLVTINFFLGAGVRQTEARMFVPEPGAVWEISLPVFERKPDGA